MTGTLMSLLLAGDVMLGRGVDQILPDPSDPALNERFTKDARDYVSLAERENGPIPAPVDFDYVWHDALEHFEAADASIINLETAVTTSDEAWPNKGINYRMNPANAPVLAAADIDIAVLANNHVLDWGRPGLDETLATLHDAGIATAGAGATLDGASAPAIIKREGQARVLVLAAATSDCGVPDAWAAADDRSGVNFLPNLYDRTFDRLAATIRERAEVTAIVVVSIHWGGNWGYAIPDEQTRFAHRLIDEAGVDVVLGHSSHHPKAVEVHNGRLILYGAGDLINDYEGIHGHERYRPDLSLLYLPRLDETGRLAGLDMAPMRIERMRLNRATDEEAHWLQRRLDRESSPFGVRIELNEDDMLTASWNDDQ